jgi:hypothetical protein
MEKLKEKVIKELEVALDEKNFSEISSRIVVLTELLKVIKWAD